MEYARLDEVVDSYEGTIPLDRMAWVAKQLKHATSLLRGKLPQLDTWIATGRVPASEACRVVCEVVLRRVRNPAGIRQENAETSGYVRDATAASGRLMVLDEELAALTPKDDDTSRGVSSVSLAIPGWRVP